MKNWKYINGAEVGNAFDFETQAVVDRKEAVKTAEEELRKAEAERNKHRGERYWEEAYITAKKDVERAKENLARAQRNKAGNSDGVARMFQGLVKDENKDEKHYEGAIDDLEKVGNKGRINYDDDLVVVKHNGTVTYKGLEDYEPDKYAPWKYNESEGVYELPDGWTKEKVSNSKVGNYVTGKSKLKPGDKVSIYGSKGTVKDIIGENTDNIYGEPLIKVELESGKTVTMGEHYCIKIGNRSSWNSDRSIYAKWDEQKGRPSDEYARLTWLGQGKGGLVNIWKGQSMTSEKFGSTDRKELERWAEQRIGNAKVGNIQFAGDYYDIIQENPEEFYIYLNGGARRYGPYRTKAAAEIELKKILDRRNRTGNSYSDKLPTAMDYRKALDEIIEKKNLNPDEARRKYGQFTYAQWEKELGHKIENGLARARKAIH